MLPLELIGDRLTERIDAADRRDDVQVVANPDIAVHAHVAFEGAGRCSRSGGSGLRMVVVREIGAKIRGEIVGMDPAVRLDAGGRVADGGGELHHVLALGDWRYRELVPGSDRLGDRDGASTVHGICIEDNRFPRARGVALLQRRGLPVKRGRQAADHLGDRRPQGRGVPGPMRVCASFVENS